MSDLIDRAAAVKYLMLNMGWHDEDGREVDDACEKRPIIEDLVNGIPTIEAVPLDKLCEWLAKNDYEIFCYLCHDAFDADGGCPNQVYEKQWLCGSKGHWKAFLMKAMEGWKDEAGS